MVLSNLEEHKSSAARVDKESLDCRRKKATKLCFLLPCAFHFQQTNSVTQAMLYWMQTVLPDQPVITGVTRYSTFLSLAQITKQNSPNSRSAVRAQPQEFHTAVFPVLSALTATKATGKWIDSSSNQRGLQGRILFSVFFSFKPRCLCLFWQTSVLPFKYFARFRD